MFNAQAGEVRSDVAIQHETQAEFGEDGSPPGGISDASSGPAPAGNQFRRL
jgi:hypothetical protein